MIKTNRFNLSFLLQIIDPYVKVDFHGIPADTSSFKTKVLKDNGELQLVHVYLLWIVLKPAVLLG